MFKKGLARMPRPFHFPSAIGGPVVFLVVALAAWSCLVSGPPGFASDSTETGLESGPCNCDASVQSLDEKGDNGGNPYILESSLPEVLDADDEAAYLSDKGRYCFWGVCTHDGRQCVEYVVRFWRKTWGYWDSTPSIRCAYELYSKARQKSLVPCPNGGKRRPRQGDILVFNRTDRYRCGHVAIVKRVNLYTGSKQWAKILVIEQNWGGRGHQAWLGMKCSHRRWYVPRRAGMQCQGWLRAKRDCTRRHRGGIWYVSPGDGAGNLKRVRWFTNSFYRRNSMGHRHSRKLVRPTGNAWDTGRGWYQQCENGGLSLANGAPCVRAVYNTNCCKFYSKWRSLGRWRGWLGHATSDRYSTVSGYVKQRF